MHQCLLRNRLIRIMAVIYCSCLHLYAAGQAKDSTGRFDRWKNNNIFQFFRNAITEGKIIRRIYLRGYGFEQTFIDTSKRLEYFGTNLLNHLHHKTHDWVIRDNLFVKEGTPVNAYKL